LDIDTDIPTLCRSLEARDAGVSTTSAHSGAKIAASHTTTTAPLSTFLHLATLHFKLFGASFEFLLGLCFFILLK
jgi:hypothetical protein